MTTFWKKKNIECCLCMQDFIRHYSGSVCQAHCRIITLISTCHFRGWRNLFTPCMGHSYPNSFQGWLWQISSQQPASQQLKLKKWAARAATDDTPTPHSGGQLLCADDLNMWISWWACFMGNVIKHLFWTQSRSVTLIFFKPYLQPVSWLSSDWRKKHSWSNISTRNGFSTLE